MRILLAVDGSKFSEATTKAVIAQYRPQGTAVCVLHVVGLPTLSAPPHMAASYAPELREEVAEARKMVERIAGVLRGAGFETTAEVLKADVREGILDAAKEWHADLIVVGSHGRTGIGRLLMGSVAEAVVRHAPCSVEVVRIPQQ